MTACSRSVFPLRSEGMYEQQALEPREPVFEVQPFTYLCVNYPVLFPQLRSWNGKGSCLLGVL